MDGRGCTPGDKPPLNWGCGMALEPCGVALEACGVALEPCGLGLEACGVRLARLLRRVIVTVFFATKTVTVTSSSPSSS